MLAQTDARSRGVQLGDGGAGTAAGDVRLDRTLVACTRSSSRRPISIAANGSPATSARAGPRHSPSASRAAPAASSRSKRTRSTASPDAQLVAAAVRDDLRAAWSERLAQARDVDVHHLPGARRQIRRPQPLDEAVGTHHPVDLQREHRQDRTLLAAAGGQLDAVHRRPDRPQEVDADLRHHSVSRAPLRLGDGAVVRGASGGGGVFCVIVGVGVVGFVVEVVARALSSWEWSSSAWSRWAS